MIERGTLKKDGAEIHILFVYEDVQSIDEVADRWQNDVRNGAPSFQAGVNNVLEGWEREYIEALYKVPVRKPPRLSFAQMIKVIRDTSRELPERRPRGDPANYRRSSMFGYAIHNAYEHPERIQYRNMIEEEMYLGVGMTNERYEY